MFKVCFEYIQPNNAENKLNVRAWIEAYDAKIIRKIPLVSVLDSGIVGNTDRQEFIRIVCAEIVKLNNDMYVIMIFLNL